MRYPSRSDYCCSIRNPAFAFRKKDSFTGRELVLDAALVKGSPVERVQANGMRNLWSASGSFAIAFKYQTPSPAKVWAVRCLYRSTFDVTQHYQQALRHLKRNPCQKYFVDFEFLQEGIRVQGQCYPILKMAWVEGPNLKKFIKANLRNPAKLRELADRWVELVRDLHLAGIAHGDFQHGNVLVVEEFGRLALKLIDYDSLYFTKAKQPAEDSIKGISNYQHPLRKSLSHRCLAIDYFPALVIYLSILALERNPKLWNNYDLDNTEGLLFEAADFLNPGQSSVFRNLKRLPKPVSNLARQLQEICELEQFQQLPSLDEVIIGRTIAASVEVSSSGVVSSEVSSSEVSSEGAGVGVSDEAGMGGVSSAVARQLQESLMARMRVPQLFSNWSLRRRSSHQIVAPAVNSESSEAAISEAAISSDAVTSSEVATGSEVVEPTLASLVEAEEAIAKQASNEIASPQAAEQAPAPDPVQDSVPEPVQAPASVAAPSFAAPRGVKRFWQRITNARSGHAVEGEASAPSSVATATETASIQTISAETATAETATAAASRAPEDHRINWPVLFKELLEFGFRFSLGSVYLVAVGVLLCLALPLHAGQAGDAVAEHTATEQADARSPSERL